MTALLHCLTVRIAWHYDSLLTSLIARGPALGEGAGPFTRILGLADDPTQGAAEAQGLLQRLVQGALGHLLCRPDGQWRMAGNTLGDVTGGGQQLVGGHDPTHQTHPQCGGRVDGIAGQDHLHRHGLWDRPHEALRAATAPYWLIEGDRCPRRRWAVSPLPLGLCPGTQGTLCGCR